MNLEILKRQTSIYTLEMIKARGFGHVGGSFSIIEVLTVLFGKYMNIDPKNPTKVDRDYFVLSKGHAGPAYYSVLAALGYYAEDEIYTLNQNGTNLPSHPDKNLTVGVDATTGSLGQGLSQAAGIALGCKLKGLDNYTYAIIGDGESNEGQIWEALQFIKNKNLDNLIVFVDNNKIQTDGFTKDISFDFKFKEIFKNMGFYTQEVVGNSLEAIDEAIAKAISKKVPAIIVLDTIKGQGLNKYADQALSHHLRLSEADLAYFDQEIARFKKELSEYEE